MASTSLSNTLSSIDAYLAYELRTASELHSACSNGDLRAVEALVDGGADVNARIGHKTPMYIACEKGNYELVVSLIAWGATVRLEKNALVKAIECGTCDETTKFGLMVLLLANGADVNGSSTTVNGFTPLHAAASAGSAEGAKLLIDRGALVNTPEEDNWYTGSPLHTACRHGHLEVMQVLIENGADVSAVCAWGETPVFQALVSDCDTDGSIEKRLAMIRLLVDNGASLNWENRAGDTPLHKICGSTRCHPQLTSFLLLNGACINARNANGKNPLHVLLRSLVSNEDEQVDAQHRHNVLLTAKRLIQNGAAVEILDNDDVFVHLMLFRNEDTEIMELILSRQDTLWARVRAEAAERKPQVHFNQSEIKQEREIKKEK